jgi:hypothetical protein
MNQQARVPVGARPAQNIGKTEMKFGDKKQRPHTTSGVVQPQGRNGPKVYDIEELEQMNKAATAARTIANATAAKPVVEMNATYSDVTLPSNFYFYPWKSLAVRPVRGAEQAKFARAYRDGRMRHVVDAISSTLEQGKSAYDLTTNDFYWLMYYQRLTSNKKTQYLHKTFCENPEHLKKVVAGELEQKTMEISQVISQSILKETLFDPATLIMPSFADRIPVATARMRDMVEVSEMDEKENFEELAWLADRAAYIAPIKGRHTLMDRIKVVQDLSSEEMDEMEAYISSATAYGVKESLTVRCGGCGAEMVSQVTIDALSFLPAHR